MNILEVIDILYDFTKHVHEQKVPEKKVIQHHFQNSEVYFTAADQIHSKMYPH